MELAEIKSYLKIDDDILNDDNYITELLSTVQSYIDSCVGEGYKTDTKLVSLSNIVMKKMVKDLYDNRSQYVDKTNRDVIVTTILDVLANASDEVVI